MSRTRDIQKQQKKRFSADRGSRSQGSKDEISVIEVHACPAFLYCIFSRHNTVNVDGQYLEHVPWASVTIANIIIMTIFLYRLV